MILIAKGFAGLVGPSVYDYVMEATGSLDTTLKVFSILLLLAFVISMLMKRSIKNFETENDKKVAVN